jgi:hypothetical protein
MKQPENIFSCCFGGIGATPNGPKKVHKGPQVDRIYVPMFKLENRPLTISISLSLGRSSMEKPENKFFCAVLGHLGTPKWTKKVLKGPQVGGMYVPMSRIEHKLVTKSKGPFL